MMNEIRLIYKAAVDAVKPSLLVNQAIRCTAENVVTIQEEFEIEVDKNCHVIGKHFL
jgi:hypothetical protein